MRSGLIGLAGTLCVACAASPGHEMAQPSYAEPLVVAGTQMVRDEGPPLPNKAPEKDYCREANGRNVIGRWICRAVDHPTFWRWAMTAGFTAIGFAIYHSLKAPGGCPDTNVTVTHGTDPITGKPTTVEQYSCH